MRIRTQLSVAFVLLAVLPLLGIVLYSYVTTQRAVRALAAADADALARQMAARMARVRAEVAAQVKRVGPELFRVLMGPDSPEARRQAAELVATLGDDIELVHSFVVEPASAPRPPAPPSVPSPPPVPSLSAPTSVPTPGDRAAAAPPDIDRPPGDGPPPMRVEVSKLLAMAEERTVEGVEAAAPVIGAAVGLGLQALNEALEGDFVELIAEAERVAALEAAAAEGGDTDAEVIAARRAARQQRLGELGARIGARFQRVVGGLGVPQAGPQTDVERRLRALGFDIEAPVRDGERLIGRLRPGFDPDAIMRRVIGRFAREGDEIPYVIDAEGQLWTADEADLEILQGLPREDLLPRSALGDPAAAEEASTALAVAPAVVAAGGAKAPAVRGRLVDDRWLVVVAAEPGSDLVFGIVRPIGESFAALRRTAVRNFAAGLGLIVVALLGILPLSRRMTLGLEQLSAGARRIAEGDLGVRVPVRSRDEIGELATTFNRMAGDLHDNQQRLVEQELGRRMLEVELARTSDELEAARQFQLSMLPKRLPEHPSYQVAVAMRTATEVGGDYYDFHLGDDGTLTVAVGDATGHGATAGRMVTVVKSLFTAHAGEAGLESFLTGAHRTIQRMDLGRMAMALLLARLTPTSLRVASAGMPPALIWRRASATVEELEISGMPLGSLDYAYRAREVPLAAGDLVLLMSDGLPELPGGDGEPFGYDAVRRAFEQAAAGTPQAVIDALGRALDARTGGEAPDDDVTLVAIRVV